MGKDINLQGAKKGYFDQIMAFFKGFIWISCL